MCWNRFSRPVGQFVSVRISLRCPDWPWTSELKWSFYLSPRCMWDFKDVPQCVGHTFFILSGRGGTRSLVHWASSPPPNHILFFSFFSFFETVLISCPGLQLIYSPGRPWTLDLPHQVAPPSSQTLTPSCGLHRYTRTYISTLTYAHTHTYAYTHMHTHS